MTILKQTILGAAFALVMAFGWLTTASASTLAPVGALAGVVEGENSLTKVHYRHRHSRRHYRRYRRCHRHRSRKYRHCHTYRRHSHHGHYRHHRPHYFGPQIYFGRHGLSFGFGF